jgi:ApbE superfamily uncharacterized protein (UPF0280 family)
MKGSGYEPRRYRESLAAPGLRAFTVRYLETDLWLAVAADAPAEAEAEARLAVLAARRELEDYIAGDPVFLTTLEPHEPARSCPEIVRAMADAAAKAGVGPLAAGAGAGEALFGLEEVIVENGGDIYLRSRQVRHIAVYAGRSPLSNRVAIAIDPSLTPLGVGTSSGTVGHSLSFGRADAATVLAKDAATADAYATALGNRVKGPADLDAALAWAAARPDVLGAVAVAGDRIGAVGQVELVPYGGK